MTTTSFMFESGGDSRNVNLFVSAEYALTIDDAFKALIERIELERKRLKDEHE